MLCAIDIRYNARPLSSCTAFLWFRLLVSTFRSVPNMVGLMAKLRIDFSQNWWSVHADFARVRSFMLRCPRREISSIMLRADQLDIRNRSEHGKRSRCPSSSGKSMAGGIELG